MRNSNFQGLEGNSKEINIRGCLMRYPEILTRDIALQGFEESSQENQGVFLHG